MIGLIVKGSTAVFLCGKDPGGQDAVAVVNRLRAGNSRSWGAKLDALGLERVARPVPLVRESLDWVYVFVTLTEGDDRRLEPGPFDDELANLIAAVEAEQRQMILREQISPKPSQ